MNKITSDMENIGWHFDNSYTRLPDIMMSKIKPIPVKKPKLVILNSDLSNELGLNFSNTKTEILSSLLSGNILPKKSNCIAQAYAGHQFGYFTILGDGRAIVIGEHVTKNNKRFDIQFKGSGRTPFSRNGDGRAALGPMLREYIISEAMYALGIPTTRSLAVVKTGETVHREKPLEGAILTRVASSHIRVGTFQYLVAKDNKKNLKTLLEYTIDRHYPEIKKSNTPVIDLLKIVIKKQAELVTDWMRIGFIHGVMNTDNMTISGETIDYGPCAFMDTYNPQTVFSSIDLQGRYSFFNQPGITKWNLARFAESLILLIHENKEEAIKIATDTVNSFDEFYKKNWLDMMRKKLGLFGEESNDESLIFNLLSWMHQNKADYTNTFCFLMNEDFAKSNIYKNQDFINWKEQWQKRLNLKNNSYEKSLKLMHSSNPLIIPRNHKVEEALEAANNGNFDKINNLVEILKNPYQSHKKNSEYCFPAPKSDKKYQTFCGT
tara:strand:+ start:225 stop:1700 length:1476 start_codon:yes stop_codon:yes gene_type:complete